MWPPTSFDIGDNIVVLSWVERFYLVPPTKRKDTWKLVFQFVNGKIFYISYDNETDARTNFEKIRTAYHEKPDFASVFEK